MSIVLKLDKGFQKMIQDIELSEKESKRVAESCINQAAQIMQADLKTEMKASDFSSSVADRMPPFVVRNNDGKFRASVGFESTPYTPKNLSDFHKVIFANYGTPLRTKHGKERARGFIQRAKKGARPKIKKAQKSAFDTILKRLK